MRDAENLSIAEELPRRDQGKSEIQVSPLRFAPVEMTWFEGDGRDDVFVVSGAVIGMAVFWPSAIVTGWLEDFAGVRTNRPYGLWRREMNKYLILNELR